VQTNIGNHKVNNVYSMSGEWSVMYVCCRGNDYISVSTNFLLNFGTVSFFCFAFVFFYFVITLSKLKTAFVEILYFCMHNLQWKLLKYGEIYHWLQGRLSGMFIAVALAIYDLVCLFEKSTYYHKITIGNVIATFLRFHFKILSRL
jgi:hypothetical protein